MMRVLIPILFTLWSGSLLAQYNDAETYTEPSEFELGDNIILNQPSQGDRFTAVYYTFQAAKNLIPNLTEETYEKIYLSNQFQNAHFTIVKIDSIQAILSYGEVEEFAVLDIHLGIKRGEVGDRSKMVNIWDVEQVQAEDIVELMDIGEKERYQSIWVHPVLVSELTKKYRSEKVFLPREHHGSRLKINRYRKKVATLGNDTTQEFALANLRLGLELNEIEIIKGEIAELQEQAEEEVVVPDSVLFAADTVERISIFKKWGVFPYVFPLAELSAESISSFSVGGGGGVIIGDKWQVGAYVQIYEGGFSETVVFPNSFVLDYSFGGVYGGYQFFEKGKFRLLAEAKVGLGEAAWTLEESGETLESDNFMIINPRVSMDYHLNGFSIVNLALGYRAFSGLDLLQLDNSSLSSFVLSASLKLGWFK